MLSELTQEVVHIPGPLGTLAGELAYPEQSASGMVLLANPHPHMGGRQENYLIACLATYLAERGWLTLRFDYSGVGNSEGPRVDMAESMAAFWATGHAPEDSRFLDDVRSVITWLCGEFNLPLTIVGYSFGSYAAVSAMPDDPAAIILISPTINQHDFSLLSHCTAPKLVIYSDNDFATPFEITRDWFENLPDPKQQVCMSGGEHFYRSRERDVADVCAHFIAQSIRTSVRQPSR